MEIKTNVFYSNDLKKGLQRLLKGVYRHPKKKAGSLVIRYKGEINHFTSANIPNSVNAISIKF